MTRASLPGCGGCQEMHPLPGHFSTPVEDFFSRAVSRTGSLVGSPPPDVAPPPDGTAAGRLTASAAGSAAGGIAAARGTASA